MLTVDYCPYLILTMFIGNWVFHLIQTLSSVDWCLYEFSIVRCRLYFLFFMFNLKIFQCIRCFFLKAATLSCYFPLEGLKQWYSVINFFFSHVNKTIPVIRSLKICHTKPTLLRIVSNCLFMKNV